MTPNVNFKTKKKKNTKTKTKTKLSKDPTCAIFLKSLGFKDIKYDISASSVHHQCIISASSAHHQCIISASSKSHLEFDMPSAIGLAYTQIPSIKLNLSFAQLYV